MSNRIEMKNRSDRNLLLAACLLLLLFCLAACDTNESDENITDGAPEKTPVEAAEEAASEVPAQPTEEPAEETLLYSGSSISFTYPANWTLRETPGEDGGRISLSDEKLTKNPVFLFLQGEAWRLNPDYTEKDYEDLLKDSYENLEILELSDCILDAYEGTRLVFSYTDLGKEYRVVRYMLVHDLVSYEISYNYPVEKEAEYEEKLQAVTDSIRFVTQVESGVEELPFSYQNAYNKMICVDGENTYIGREDGIYLRRGKTGEEESVFENTYELNRGMELYQGALYFSGSVQRGEETAATIYRMDLQTGETVDAMAALSQTFDSLYGITVYEGTMYVATGYGVRSGFILDENGLITGLADVTAEYFLFREYNEYMNLQLQILNNEVVYDTKEYWSVVEQMNEKYCAMIDVAACMRMLDGAQVVRKYKDELLSEAYLETADGNYEFLCDFIGFPALVTETGLYYAADESGDIWYVDYESRTPVKVYEKEGRELESTTLLQYDGSYVYFLKEGWMGRTEEGISVTETYLMRVPRLGGDAEKVYQFEDDFPARRLSGSCGIDEEYMYFGEHETISLDPAENGMEEANSGAASEDAREMTDVIEGFAEAFFDGDETAMEAFLAEDFAGDKDVYAYPENADQIREQYIAGLPEGNVSPGLCCVVSYEFSGSPEADGALTYLTMELRKTENGWKIISYGVEQ